MFAGISLRQAPPLSVIFSFFLNAKIFLLLAGVLYFFLGVNLALIHTLTLGFLLSMIFGATFQMLPVLAGIHIKKPRFIAFFTLLFLDFGIFCFLARFIFEKEIFFAFALAFLNLGIWIFLIAIFLEIKNITHKTATIYYMLVALFCLALLSIFGVILGLKFAGVFFDYPLEVLLSTHILLAICFVVLLIFGVILQVLPMFYVACNFPKIFYKIFMPFLFIFLLLNIVFAYFDSFFAWDYFIFDFSNVINPLSLLLLGLIFVSLSGFAIKTLFLRKRKIKEISIWFWYFGFFNLLLCGILCFVMLSFRYFAIHFTWILELIRIFFAFGFVFSIVFAMFFKIVPFLTWFHLSFQGVMNLPNMREIITQNAMKVHFMIFIVGYFLLLCGVRFAFALSLIALGIVGIFHIFRAYRLYLHTLKTSPKMKFE